MRQINLLPEEVQKAEKKKPIKNSIIIAVILSLMVLTSSHFLITINVNRLEKVASQPPVTEEGPIIDQLSQKIAQIEKERQKFIDKNRTFLDILSRRLPHAYILKTLGDATSEKVWLKKFSVDSQKGTCQIEGSSFNTQLVSEFLFELKKSSYFEDVQLTSIERLAVPEKVEVQFRINCALK